VLLRESAALLQTQQHAADANRWGEVFRLGRILDGALVLGSRWGAWATALDRCLAGAKATGDRGAEAWALHQVGTRALCLGDPTVARAMLGHAVKLREALPDDAAADASRGNLGFVIVPASEKPIGFDLDALPLRDAGTSSARVRKAPGVAAAAIAVPLLAGLGWLGGWAFDTLWSAKQQPVQGRLARPSAAPPRADGSSAVLETAADVAPLASGPPAAAERSSILIFTARPGSTTRSTQICYAVSGAYQARIEPTIGEVAPTPTLTCRRVAPARTTTYQLTAYGRDGQQARQQVVVFVR
jgi:hypothetical protein